MAVIKKHELASMTLGGLVLLVLTTLKDYFQVNVTENELEQAAEVVLWIIGTLMVYFGRVRHGDLWLVKKPSDGDS